MSDAAPLNLDNIIDSVARISTEVRTAKASGNPYTVIAIHFHDGYVYESFLNNEQQQLIKYSVKNKPATQSII